MAWATDPLASLFADMPLIEKMSSGNMQYVYCQGLG
jgi:hypothetical protein